MMDHFAEALREDAFPEPGPSQDSPPLDNLMVVVYLLPHAHYSCTIITWIESTGS